MKDTGNIYRAEILGLNWGKQQTIPDYNQDSTDHRQSIVCKTIY